MSKERIQEVIGIGDHPYQLLYEQIQEELKKTLGTLREVRSETAKLAFHNDALQRENDRLIGQIVHLENENADLERKIEDLTDDLVWAKQDLKNETNFIGYRNEDN